MPDSRKIALAESCSAVRASIGRALLASPDSPEHAAALEAYRKSLRWLLRLAREEECGLYLEVAGEVATKS